MEFFDVFNDERMPVSSVFISNILFLNSTYNILKKKKKRLSFQILQSACRGVRREVTFQLGRLRGFGPATVNLQFNLVRILANKMSPLRFGNRKGDCRVFLWKGRILTRKEYLKMNDINMDGTV